LIGSRLRVWVDCNHSENVAADSLQIVKSETIESIYGCKKRRGRHTKRRTTLGVNSAIIRARRGGEEDAAKRQGHHHLCGDGLDHPPDDEPPSATDPRRDRARCDRRGRGGGGDPASACARSERWAADPRP